MGGGARFHVIPNGYDLPAPAPPWKPAGRRIGMIGKFPYEPNREGLLWFRERAWPLVRREVPDAELRVVGEWSDRMFAGDAEGCTGLGFVEDPAAEMATWSASIVPLRVGGGTRIKIAEAFARGIPVVSTRVGAFGYPAEDGREILLADEPEAFAAACVRLLREPSLGAALAERARALHAAHLTWEAAAPAVAAAFEAARGGDRAR
jgi:glycosyltransferase involved in cell wall biosynthesis